MKTKLIFTGIALALITACGVTNSKKFNPQSINGVWSNVGTFGPTDDYVSFWYFSFLYVNYPYLQGCTTFQKRSHAGVLLDSALTKVKLKVAHIRKNNFRIKRINGNIVNSKDKIEIEVDSSYNIDLTVYNIKDGKKSQMSPIYTYDESSPGSGFQDCLKNAKDTTGYFLLKLK